MLHVNLDYNGKKETFNFGAVPRVGDTVIHPQWKGTKVVEVIFDIEEKTKEVSIIVRLEDEK